MNITQNEKNIIHSTFVLLPTVQRLRDKYREGLSKVSTQEIADELVELFKKYNSNFVRVKYPIFPSKSSIDKAEFQPFFPTSKEWKMYKEIFYANMDVIAANLMLKVVPLDNSILKFKKISKSS